MKADKILKKYEDENEFHFHEIDRKFIIEAMEEYLNEKLKLLGYKLLKKSLSILDNTEEYEA